MSTQVVRLLTWLVAALVGAVYGTAATIAHAYRFGVLPVGLVLAVIGTAALIIALRLLLDDRWSALAGGLGILLAMTVFSNIGPGGSAVVAAPTPETAWIPMTWTFAVPIVVAIVVAWPDVSRLSTGRKLEQ